MLFSRTTTPLFLATLLSITTTTFAAPTRTQCRCKLVSDSAPQPVYTPSIAHWAPSDPTPSASPGDTCSNLGAELEAMEHSHPDIYHSYVIGSPRKPIPTTVLLSATASTPSPRQRIVCVAEEEGQEQTSCLGLWALQIVVAVLVMACVVEGFYLVLQSLNKRAASAHNNQISEKPSLRLSGGERPLLAIPASNIQAEFLLSPGAEKKKRAYETTRYFVKHSPSGRREFIAYDDEDDDEACRPVM